MDPWSLVGQGIAEGFYRGQDRRDKKKALEEEYAQRMNVIREQQRLQNEAPTSEEKLLTAYQNNPDLFRNFQMAQNPFARERLDLDRAQFGLSQQQFNQQAQNQNYSNQMDYWKGLRQNWQDQHGFGSNRQRDFQFLMQMPGMTRDQALQYLFRPDLMTQMFMGGGFGAPGAGVPNYGMSGAGVPNYGQ